MPHLEALALHEREELDDITVLDAAVLDEVARFDDEIRDSQALSAVGLQVADQAAEVEVWHVDEVAGCVMGLLEDGEEVSADGSVERGERVRGDRA